MWARIERITDTAAFRLAIVATLALSLTLNAFALAKPSDRPEDVDTLGARLAAVETDTAELRQSQLELLDRAFRLQTDIAAMAPDLERSLGSAREDLEEFRTSDIVFDVTVDESLPIEATIPIRRTIDVAIDTTLPINETIDTTIAVDGPFGLTIPVGVTVPIELDLPVQLTVPLTIDETVPIATSVPIAVSVPVVVDVDETELVRLVDGLAAMLDALGQVLDSLG